MRYGLVAGSAVLLLLALLGVAIAPGGASGRQTSAEAREAGTETGPGASALDATASVQEGRDRGRAESRAESATGVGPRVVEPLSEDTSGIDLELEAAGGLHVRVVEAGSGRELEGASVQSPTAPEVRWREEGVGRFRAAPLLPGAQVLIVRAPGHGAMQRTVTVDPGAVTEVDVALPLEAVLAGRVLGPEGLGLEGARIDLMGPGRGGAAEVRTGADGRFEVRELTGDTYDLRVERSGYLPVAREVRLPRSEPLQLSLSPAAAVAVKVFGARGEPVEEASVSLSLVGEGRGETVREEGTDARGGVHFGGLVPGSYIAKVRAPGYLVSEPVPVEAWDEEAVPVTLVLREGLTLSGRVRDERGLPIGEAEVGVLEEGTSVGGALTDAQGHFTLSGLVPGRLRLRVEKLGHPPRDVEVVVPAANVELMMEGSGSDD
jgi:protocatechuate 3,4-dioxygenase beta subunit